MQTVTIPAILLLIYNNNNQLIIKIYELIDTLMIAVVLKSL